MVALRRLFRQANLDVIGFSASAVCAIHCTVVPMLLVFGSLSHNHLTHNHHVESAVLVVSCLLGSFSLIPAMKNTHRRRLPLAIFLIGITTIVAGRFPVPLLWETILTTTGAGLVAFAHYLNWRLCRSCAVHVAKED